MVLNQMTRCLERQNWSEGLMKTVQLTWLYKHAISILQEENTLVTPERYDLINILFHILYSYPSFLWNGIDYQILCVIFTLLSFSLYLSLPTFLGLPFSHTLYLSLSLP